MDIEVDAIKGADCGLGQHQRSGGGSRDSYDPLAVLRNLHEAQASSFTRVLDLLNPSESLAPTSDFFVVVPELRPTVLPQVKLLGASTTALLVSMHGATRCRGQENASRNFWFLERSRTPP